jgi:hypothetical protein
LIEIANRTLKKRLTAYGASIRRKDWANHLEVVLFRLNTTTSAALPRRRTPYQIWFSRNLRWIHQRPIPDNEETADEAEREPADTEGGEEADDEADTQGSRLCVTAAATPESGAAAQDAGAVSATPESGAAASAEDTEIDGIVLTAYEKEVAVHGIKLREHMGKKGLRTAKEFEAGEIATLSVEGKYRTKLETSRIYVRVIDRNRAGYRLNSKYDHHSTMTKARGLHFTGMADSASFYWRPTQ